MHPLLGCQSGHVCWGRAFLCIVTVTPILSLDLQSRLRKYRRVANAWLYQLAVEQYREGRAAWLLARTLQSLAAELQSNDPRPASPWSPATTGHHSPLSSSLCPLLSLSDSPPSRTKSAQPAIFAQLLPLHSQLANNPGAQNEGGGYICI